MPSLPLTRWERVNDPLYAHHFNTQSRWRFNTSPTWTVWADAWDVRLYNGSEIVDSVRSDDGNGYSHLWRIIQRGPSDPLYKNFRNWDLGNNFQASKTYYRDNSIRTNWTGTIGSRTWDYKDLFLRAWGNFASSPTSLFPILPWVDSMLLDAAGTTAIARSAPGNPAADTVTALAELLRDRPRLPGSALRKRRGPGGAADEYLNYVFGIKPTIEDIKEIADVYRNQASIVKQYERDHGKRVRRRYRFDPIETRTVTEVSSSFYPSLRHVGAPWDNPSKLMKYETVERQYSFSGAFRYHLDIGEDLRSRVVRNAQIAHLLYGASFTPDVVWNLTPYSWLVDWVTNAGDVISNITNFALINMVMQYGYIMCETKRTIRYELQSSDIPFIGKNLWQEFVVHTKQRRKATPYGFGLDPANNFSSQQWAILAALGISRGGKDL